MDKVKILIQGYARRKEDGRWDATSTTVLVQSDDKFILIDPGVKPGDLESSLEKEKLSLDDIDIVMVTHSHYDHARNTRLFEKNKTCDITTFLKQCKASKIPVNVPDTGIMVLLTPGHVDKHISYLVNTEAGKYAIAGDVFWWEMGQEQKVDVNSLLNHKDPVANNEELLRNSRTNMINNADIIIPGHGKEFSVLKYKI